MSYCFTAPKVIYQGTDRDFYAFRADGSTKWSCGEFLRMAYMLARELAEETGAIDEAIEKAALTGSMQSPPIIDEARYRLYVTKGFITTSIIALNIDNGAQIWRCSFDTAVHTASRLGPYGLIYATGYSGTLCGINPDSGAALAFQVCDDSIHAAPVIGDNGLIYVGSINEGILYAIDPGIEAPTMRWQTSVGSEIVFPVAFGDGRVYVVTENRLLAFNAEDGSPLWEHAIEGVAHLTKPVFNDTVNAVYVAGGNRLFAFSSEGRSLGVFTATEGQVFPFAPAVGGGTDQRLLCIGSAPPINAEGPILLHVIHVGGIDGHINIARGSSL